MDLGLLSQIIRIISSPFGSNTVHHSAVLPWISNSCKKRASFPTLSTIHPSCRVRKMEGHPAHANPCPLTPTHHPTAHRFESPRFHKSTESDSPTVSCPTSWKNCLKSRRSLLTRATLSLFARIILWMQPPIPVLCTPPRLSLTPRLKASMQPEYAHIVEAAVQYAKVGRGVSVLRILTQCRSTRRRTRSA